MAFANLHQFISLTYTIAPAANNHKKVPKKSQSTPYRAWSCCSSVQKLDSLVRKEQRKKSTEGTYKKLMRKPPNPGPIAEHRLSIDPNAPITDPVSAFGAFCLFPRLS